MRKESSARAKTGPVVGCVAELGSRDSREGALVKILIFENNAVRYFTFPQRDIGP